MSTAAIAPATPKTTGEAFIASKGYQAHQGAHHPGDIYSVELTRMPFVRPSFKAAGDPITMQSWVTAPGTQPVGIPLGLIDFIPEERINATSLAVPVQTTLGTGEIAPVSTAAAKPAVTDVYTSTTVPMEVIAGWIRVTTQAMDDADQAGYSLTDPLLRRVRFAEENQVVNGTGTSPQLKGVLTTAGITTAATYPAAIGAVGSAGYMATMVVVNPADVEKLRVTGSTAGASNYDPIRQLTVLYGLPVVQSLAVPVGTGIVGDWANGAMIWRSWDARIVVGHVNDDILKNLLTVVGESRLAFLVTHPTAFAKFTIT